MTKFEIDQPKPFSTQIICS